MNRFRKSYRVRAVRGALAVAAGTAGIATAALVGIALAKTFTLQTAKGAVVTNQSGSTAHETIVVTSRGFAVYALKGDSVRHPKCTKANSCFMFWPPVTVRSSKQLSKSPGATGKLGVWRRNGFLQVTLAGHPLYRFAADKQRDHATGEGITSFGGTWHVVKAAGSSAGGTTTSTTTTTAPPTMCLYPPC